MDEKQIMAGTPQKPGESMNEKNRIVCGDALEVLREMPDQSVHMCVTSPPYFGLRDYGIEGQLGLERTPKEYVERLRVASSL